MVVHGMGVNIAQLQVVVRVTMGVVRWRGRFRVIVIWILVVVVGQLVIMIWQLVFVVRQPVLVVRPLVVMVGHFMLVVL